MTTEHDKDSARPNGGHAAGQKSGVGAATHGGDGGGRRSDSTMPEIIILCDPELALADDPFPPGIPIAAMGGFSGEYASFEDMLIARVAIEAELARSVEGWQAALKAPDWIVRHWLEPGGRIVKIYGELITEQKSFILERKSGGATIEAFKTSQRVRDAASRGWLYGRFYSIVTPNGETGCVHRSQVVHRIGKRWFEECRAQDWWPR